MENDAARRDQSLYLGALDGQAELATLRARVQELEAVLTKADHDLEAAGRALLADSDETGYFNRTTHVHERIKTALGHYASPDCRLSAAINPKETNDG